MFEEEAECLVKHKLCGLGFSTLFMDAKGSFSIPEGDHCPFLGLSVS